MSSQREGKGQGDKSLARTGGNRDKNEQAKEGKQTDILRAVQIVIEAAKGSIENTHPIKNVERIPEVKFISLEFGFPAIGIMDGGETNEPGATVSLKTETVIIAIYIQTLKDNEKCIEEIRAITENCITELRKKEHNRTGGAFEGYTRAWCGKKSEIKPLYSTNDDRVILLKLAKIEFKKQEVQTK